MSYPNQKIIHINKSTYRANFLQIGIEEWQGARREMTYGAFCLYLYLAGNADGFDLELSKQAFEKATGFKKTTYNDAVRTLIELGYLVHLQGNIYNFFTTPDRHSGHAQSKSMPEFPHSAPLRHGGQTVSELETLPRPSERHTPPASDNPQFDKIHKNEIRQSGHIPPPRQTQNSARTDKEVRQTNTEIDKINKINNIDSPSISNKERENTAPAATTDTAQETEKLQKYLSSLSDAEKEVYYATSRKLLKKGKTAQWIRIALTNKPLMVWQRYGVGLLFTPNYQSEVDTLLEEENRAREQRETDAKIIAQQMKEEPEIIYVRGKEKPRKLDLIDLETLGGIDGEEIQK